MSRLLAFLQVIDETYKTATDKHHFRFVHPTSDKEMKVFKDQYQVFDIFWSTKLEWQQRAIDTSYFSSPLRLII